MSTEEPQGESVMAGAVFENYIALVPIRSGSKGLKSKNIRSFAGLPLYLHAVRQGLYCCEGCIVSTDIESVLTDQADEGVILHRRPDELARDSTPMNAVLRDAIGHLNLEGKNIVLLQATSPLRSVSAICEAIKKHQEGSADLIMSVVKSDSTILKQGFLEGNKFTPVSKSEYCFTNRQELPDVYRPNGAVYVFSSDWFMANGGLATERISAIVLSASQSLDIDTEEDFDRAEALFKSRQKVSGSL